MAINNINTIIDQSALDNVVEKYYNEALANLGQRNIEDKQLKFIQFSVLDLITEVIGVQQENKYLILKNIPNQNKIIFSDELNIEHDFTINSTDNTIRAILLRAKIKILTELFTTLVKEVENKDTLQQISNVYCLYFPVNYIFEFLADGINESNIFGSARDIYISIVPSTFIEDHNDETFETPFLILDTQSFIKTKIYNYTFEYDETNFEYNIIYNLEYVLPYIKDDLWYINDVKTKVQAKSNDAMNLNIILAYSKINEGKLEILSGFNKQLYSLQNSQNLDLIGGVHASDDTKKVWCKIADVNNSSDIVFDILVYLPHVELTEDEATISIDSLSNNQDNDKLVHQIFANSTLIIMSTVEDCLAATDNNTKNQIINELGKNGIITTLWQYNFETNSFEYISIEKDNDGHRIALDFTTMSNYINLINTSLSKYKQLEPDNFLFTQLVFDAADSNIKHTTESNKKLNYPSFQNIQGLNYSEYYINNFNFVLKYISKIEKDNDVITRITNDRTSKYLKFDSTINSVTNKLYSKTTNNIIEFYNDWVPNYNIPLFDLSEVLIKDSNVLNRQNILTFDSEGNIYYSYIGSSFDTNYQDKDVLHIGSSEININLGNDTMLSTTDVNKFKKQNNISIDFNTIDLNGTVNIKNDLNIENNIFYNKQLWVTSTDTIGNIIKTTTIIPKYKYIPHYETDNTVTLYHILNITQLKADIISLSNNIPKNNQTKDYLYINIILKYTINSNNNEQNYYYKHGDLLYIPNLLKYLDLPENTNIVSTNNDIIYNEEDKPLYLCTNNNELSKFINLSASNGRNDVDIIIEYKNDEEHLDYTLLAASNWFIGNSLDLAYFENSQTLLINERKLNKTLSIWKLPNSLKPDN